MSTRDKPLTKEEQEEEEMRHELAEYDVKDENMSADEMKQLLNVLKASKETSFVDSPSTSSKEIKSPDNSETYSLSQKVPAPTYSYRNSMTNGTINSSEEQRENSPDTDLDKKLNFQNEKNSQEKESVKEKNFNYISDFPPLGNQSNSKSTLDVGTPKQWSKESKRPSTVVMKKMRIERYKLNPFSFQLNKDVEPLKLNEQFDESRNSSPQSIEDLDSEKFNELYNEMNEKLGRLHEIFYSSEMTAGNSPWGLPIKVAKKWNGSLDKNPVVEKTYIISNNHTSDDRRNTNSPEAENCVSADTPNSPEIPDRSTASPSLQSRSTRATKRKAIQSINSFTQAQYDSEDEFVNSKKRKPGSSKKNENEQKKDPDFEVIDVDKDNSDSEVFDNGSLHNLRKSKKQESTNSKTSEAEYPRVITPPNPNKRNLKGPRAKKKNSGASQSTAMKNKMGINDEEISKTLEAIDAHIDDNDDIEITNEIKPAPLLKTNNKKLQSASSILENSHKKEQKKIKIEEEKKKKLEIEERNRKDEIICERLQKAEDEEAKKLEKENKFRQQGDFYRDILKKKVTNPNQNKLKVPDEVSEEQLLADDEPQVSRKSTANQHSACPICQKLFPSDKIESHASECDAFSEVEDISTHGPSTSRGFGYKCVICNIFTTANGNEYEEHVSRCKDKAYFSRSIADKA